MTQKIVVIGNGMVGHHFVSTMMQSGEEHCVTVLGEEPRVAYDRVHLSEVFAGKRAEDLALSSRAEYAAWNVELVLGDRVVEIDRHAQIVTTECGRLFNFDTLVFATGSYPFVPPVPGRDHARCMSYRTIEDLHCIRRTARKSRSGVVVGGGLLGLECANALMHLGLETHVVEFAPGLMGVQLDAEGSSMLRRKIENLGVQVHTSRSTERIVAGDAAGDKAALRLDFSDGDSLHTDMVVFSAGIRPRDELARDCGLTIGARGGIVIDERCRTSDSAIYAIGECALYRGRVFGLVAPGYRMAETVAAQLCGTSRSFQGADMSTRLKLLGVDVGGIGDAHGRTEASLAFAYSDRKSQTYRRLVTSADRKRLLGAVLVGDCDSYQTLLQYYRNGLELPEDPESLIVPHRGTESGLSADLLPRRATLCGCHNVSKGEVLDAIDGGARSLAAVQAATRAGSGCGGCAGLIDDVLRREMSVPGSGEEAQQSGTADGVRHRGTVAVSPEPISAA